MMCASLDAGSYEDITFGSSKWWKKYSCVAGHKSRSPKQKHAEPEKEQMEKVPPPPPPRRMKYQDDAATKKPSGLAPDALSEAYTLYSIRQQMAISLNRMKELEEQVRSIPELKSELNQLRDENRHLQQELQNKEVELLKLKDRSSVSPVPPTNSFSSPRLSPPVTFAPQRVSPIALESLGSRLRSGSVSSNEHNRSSHQNQVLKRDVAVMCTSHTKDASIGTTPILMRSIGTNSDILENRYTKQEFNENMQISIYEYEEKNRADLAKTFISVGTQMYTPTRRELHDTASQTILETPVLKSSIGITARPRLHDAIILCKPDIRTIGSSDHRITDTLCDICDRPKRTVACGPDFQEQTAKPISLKLLDTINLVENEKPIIKKRNAGTQSEWTTNSIGAQTSFPVSSIGIQNAPMMQSEYSQCNVDTISRQTDTRGLIQLRTTQVNTDILPEPKKPLSCDSSCNTEHKKTKHCETNTPLPPRTKHSSSNTEHPRTKDIGCGDIVKPHISIACADNYCDSCKDAIKHLAKDFSKTQAALQTGKDISKIPRPKNLPSPSPVRKKFLRQNTYTITPSPSPSPSAEKKSFISLLDERAAVASSSLDPVNTSEHTTQSNEKDESNEMKQKQIIEEIADQSSKIREFCHEEGIPDFGRNLIVKEETKVRISWSRENSPTPSTSTTSTVRTVVERENSMGTNKDPMDPVEAETPCEEKKIITNKIAPSQRGQREVQAMIVNQIVSQEVTPREKIYPSKEMQAALKVINDSLQKFSSKSTDHTSATAVVQLEWFHISSTDKANPLVVEDYIDCFEDFSSALLKFVVNLTDTNGNTAMHYAVSHGNFDVVSILLDSKVCNVNQMNNAGYTSVMLVSLAKLKSMAHRTVVQRLFQMADVNIRAKKHCQTALMLAVSHGNLDMVEMLLNAGADINIQDEDGSTALMCAAEHGRVDIVKHLLSQADCDSLIQDVDGSTAFKIAWQAGHRDIGLLLYVHEQMLRSKMPSKPEQRTASQSPRHHKRQPSQ